MPQPSDLLGLSLVGQLNATIEAVEGHTFPRLTIQTVVDDEALSPDDENYSEQHYLRCPWHADDDEDARDESFAAFDISLRASGVSMDAEDYAAKHIWVSTDDDNYGGVLYILHAICGKPCSPPEGFDAEWS